MALSIWGINDRFYRRQRLFSLWYNSSDQNLFLGYFNSQFYMENFIYSQYFNSQQKYRVREIQGIIWNPMSYSVAKISPCCFAAFHTDTEAPKTPSKCCTNYCLIQRKAFHTGLATMPAENKVIRDAWVRPPHTHKPGALFPAWFQKEDCSHSYTGRNAHRAGGCPVVNSCLQASKL